MHLCHIYMLLLWSYSFCISYSNTIKFLDTVHCNSDSKNYARVCGSTCTTCGKSKRQFLQWYWFNFNLFQVVLTDTEHNDKVTCSFAMKAMYYQDLRNHCMMYRMTLRWPVTSCRQQSVVEEVCSIWWQVTDQGRYCSKHYSHHGIFCLASCYRWILYYTPAVFHKQNSSKPSSSYI